MIEVKALSVRYGKLLALDKIDLKLEKGDIYAVIGPSGCGKSTLLHVLAGIISNYEGSALIGGNAVNPKTNRIGFIPQNYGLLEWANVYSNCVLGLNIKQNSLVKDKEYIEYILEKLGLAELKAKYPNRLSGGQRQRVSIARSFILKPEILLMDEPFSALDAMTREETQDLFLKVWKENQVSTLFITHNIEEAIHVGRKIVVLSPSPGRIVKLLDNPLFGKENLRLSGEFYRFDLELRLLIKEVWSKC